MEGHGGPRPVTVAEASVGSEATTPRGAVEAMFDAYAAKDLSRWLASWSDAGFEEAFGVDKAEGALVPPSWGNVRSFQESRVELRDTSEERSGASRASLVVGTRESGIVTWHRLDLVAVDERWLVDGRTPAQPPDTGQAALEVVLVDDAIRPATTTADTDVDLRVTNRGSTRHELVLLRDRGGIDETVGRLAALAPGAEATMVARDLPPGEYTMVCSLLDGDGRPHSTLGMRAVLTVG